MNSFNVTIAHNTYRKIEFRYTLTYKSYTSDRKINLGAYMCIRIKKKKTPCYILYDVSIAQSYLYF